MSQGSVRIAVVNDYEEVVTGLARMLEPFSDRVEVVELDANAPVRQHVDVALYDTFAQAQGSDLDCAAILRSSNADHLVVFSWTIDALVAQQVIGGGASGYLSKAVAPAELVTALEQVQLGERVVRLGSGNGAGWALRKSSHRTLAYWRSELDR